MQRQRQLTYTPCSYLRKSWSPHHDAAVNPWAKRDRASGQYQQENTKPEPEQSRTVKQPSYRRPTPLWADGVMGIYGFSSSLYRSLSLSKPPGNGCTTPWRVRFPTRPSTSPSPTRDGTPFCWTGIKLGDVPCLTWPSRTRAFKEKQNTRGKKAAFVYSCLRAWAISGKTEA